MGNRGFVFILVFTFIVVMIWIAAEIYRTKPGDPVDPNLPTLLEPIEAKIDTDVFDMIKENEKVLSNKPKFISSQESSPSPNPQIYQNNPVSTSSASFTQFSGRINPLQIINNQATGSASR